MSMLQLKDINIYHKKDCRALIEDFSLVINEGDKAAIIGEEGNGKSTLLKIIACPEEVDDYIDWSGEVVRSKLKIGYLPQELPLHYVNISLYDFFSQNALFADYDYRELAQMALQQALPEDIYYSDKLLGTLSGGEKIKVQLLSILLGHPDILLLDEPSNDIDITALQWLEDFINASQLPIMYISHDETLLENTANMIVHFEQVRRKTLPRSTVQRCGYREYVEERAEKLAKQTQVARKERDEFDEKMEKYRQIRQKVDHMQTAISRSDPHGGRLLKKKMKSVVSTGRRFEREEKNLTQLPDVEEQILLRFNEKIKLANGKNVISLEIPMLYAGENRLAENIRLNVFGNEKVCITGRNGAGKTTLIKEIAALLLPRKDIKVGYMPQNYEEFFAQGITPLEFLVPNSSKDERTEAMTYLGSMKYTPEEMAHAATELSGGQKAKLYLLKLNMDGCEVLILDEPTRNLSPLSCPVVRSVLRDFGGAIIAVSHDRKFIKEVCDKEYVLTSQGLLSK